MAALLTVSGLCRDYGKHRAVNNLNFILNRGQVLGFLGVNGAGKTTTLKMLCGHLAPTSGEIIINGFNLRTDPIAAKLKLGYLPETPPLYESLTVNEFLTYCVQLHRVPQTSIKKLVHQTQEQCGLTTVSKQLISQLSKGYQQRVGIAQAIVHQPELIILDEPLVGLDPEQIHQIRELIKELATQYGVIISSHLLSEIQASCTDVQIIHQGSLVLSETMKTLDQKMHHSRFKLITRQAINKMLLMKISSITQIESLSEHHYLIHHLTDDNPIEAVTEITISQRWGLQEITPITDSLEAVFLSLTTSLSSTGV